MRDGSDNSPRRDRPLARRQEVRGRRAPAAIRPRTPSGPPARRLEANRWRKSVIRTGCAGDRECGRYGLNLPLAYSKHSRSRWRAHCPAGNTQEPGKLQLRTGLFGQRICESNAPGSRAASAARPHRGIRAYCPLYPFGKPNAARTNPANHASCFEKPTRTPRDRGAGGSGKIPPQHAAQPAANSRAKAQ